MSNVSASHENFERLLQWLHPEREPAGQVYEDIRNKLIRFFFYRGCADPDVLADVVIDRVSGAIAREGFEFVGEKIIFFYGFARNVCFESRRHSMRPKPLVTDLYPQREDPLLHACLESCLKQLAPNHRDLIISYYQYEPSNKTKSREQLAEQRGLDLNVLRIRVHRIRIKLRECMNICLESPG